MCVQAITSHLNLLWNLPHLIVHVHVCCSLPPPPPHPHTHTPTQEECEYVQKLGVTIELMNKNIFRELIFAESFMSSNLPLIIAQLR